MIRISSTHISPYSINDCCGGRGFSSIFNTTYNISGGYSSGMGGFWGGFGLGLGQAIGSFFSGFCGMFSGFGNCFNSWNMGGMFSNFGNFCGGFGDMFSGFNMSGILNTGGKLDFGNAFDNFWDNISAPASPAVTDKTNKDTKKLEDFEKEVKALEDKTAEDKAKDDFKTSVQTLYDKVLKAKNEADDIDKISDETKYNKLLERLKTLGAVESDDDGDETVDTELPEGYVKTQNSNYVYDKNNKKYYKLNEDGTIGAELSPPAGYSKIESVYADNTCRVITDKNSKGEWTVAKFNIKTGQFIESTTHKKGATNNVETLFSSKYKYNSDGTYIETRTTKESAWNSTVKYFKYSSAMNDCLYECDVNGNKKR